MSYPGYINHVCVSIYSSEAIFRTGVPCSEETATPQDPAVGSFIPRALWCSYGGGGVYYERGTPVDILSGQHQSCVRVHPFV